MPINAIIEKLEYDQKRELCLNIIHDKNNKKNKIKLTDKYLEAYIEAYLLKYSEYFDKGVIDLWLNYIADLLDDLDTNISIPHVLEIIKREISLDLQLDNKDTSYVNNKAEAICRNLILLLTEEDISFNKNIDIYKIVNENFSNARIKIIKYYTKEIKSNRLKVIINMPFALMKPDRIIRWILNTDGLIKNKKLRRKIKFTNVIFTIYTYSYLNKHKILEY